MPIAIDAYESANRALNLKPGDAGYNNSRFAAIAATEMATDGWQFCGYNNCGEEVYLPPATEDAKR